MTDSFSVTVIGAGVVGLAVAERLAREYRDVLVIERHEGFGRETSSRNSEVVHAGLYHPPGSLKARLCVRGRERLHAYCADRGVGVRGCGKLLVANDRWSPRPFAWTLAVVAWLLVDLVRGELALRLGSAVLPTAAWYAAYLVAGWLSAGAAAVGISDPGVPGSGCCVASPISTNLPRINALAAARPSGR